MNSTKVVEKPERIKIYADSDSGKPEI